MDDCVHRSIHLHFEPTFVDARSRKARVRVIERIVRSARSSARLVDRGMQSR